MSVSTNSKEEINRKGFWTANRVILTLTVVIAISALGLSSCNSTDDSSNSGSRMSSSKPANPNASAPGANGVPAAFIALPSAVRDTKVQTLDGKSIKLSDYEDKVLIVNLWATWCGPCKAEMPELIKMSQEYKSRGLVVLGLATTYNEQNDAERVKSFVRSYSVNYPIVWDDGTLTAPLVQTVHGPNSIPQSFVISRDGRIVKYFAGFNPYSTPTLMRQAVEQALSEKG